MRFVVCALPMPVRLCADGASRRFDTETDNATFGPREARKGREMGRRERR